MPRSPSPTAVGPWQIVILFLSVYVLIALLAETVLPIPPGTRQILSSLDTAICFVFIGDFVVQLVRSPRPWAYLKWGWIDLVSSLPNVEFLRWGRFVRAVRILRILRAIRSTRRILAFLFENRAQGAFATVAMIAFLLLVSASIIVLNCETDPAANIRTAGDALWWGFVTITTVGYGDRYPVTPAGRLVGAVLMAAGVGLFGTFTAFIASYFIRPSREDERRESEAFAELRSIRERLDRIEERLPPSPAPAHPPPGPRRDSGPGPDAKPA